MTIVADSTIGLEDVQRAALYVLLDHLPSAQSAIAARWLAKDEELADRLGLPFEPTELEAVPLSNFVEGHAPSLINAPVERYPNVAVMCFRAVPSPDSPNWDHASEYRNSMVIDCMVKSDSSEAETTRRIHRMAEAVNLCIQAYPTLDGVVNTPVTEPTVEVTDLFVRREKAKGHYGPEWYWQGARLSYGVGKFSPAASSTGGFMPSATGIDQE